MKSKTFKEEFDWLSQYLPEALVTSPGTGGPGENTYNNIIQTITQELNSQNLFAEDLEVNNPINLEPELLEWDSNAASFEDLYESLMEIYNTGNGQIPSEILSNLTAELGRDAYGLYLPMHYFFQSKKTPWGIYLFPQLIVDRADVLYLEKGKSLGLSKKQVRYAYCYGVFRHELFHHQVERFSTKHEILTHSENFIKYRGEVNLPSSGTENWLEEALAEATVLKSVHVFRNIEMSPKDFKELYQFDLKQMPPGYRDYHCRKFGGPAKAHKLFASQIIQTQINPYPASGTAMCTVSSNEFSKSWKEVPIYMVMFKTPEEINSPREAVQSYLKL